MNELKIFENAEFGQVRVVAGQDGEPWFVAKDVCAVLGTATKDMPAILDYDEQKAIIDSIDTLNNMGDLRKDSRVISESGLYSLVLRSRKPQAKAFKKWVTSEVLPSIRKHGVYATDSFIELSLNNPDYAIELLQKLKFERQEKELMRAQRDEAVKTKAYIGAKREATAMNTASQKAKEVKRLQIELDISKQYATIKYVEKKTGVKYSWRKIKDYCVWNGLKMKEVFDANYGTVKSYPAKAWLDVYAIKL